jgi:predicted metalloprotease
MVLAASVVGAAVLVVLIRLSGGDEDQGSAPTSTPESAAGSAVELRSAPGELPVTLDATTSSLREFWSTELEKVYGQPFRDLVGGIDPKDPDSPPWTCGGRTQTYDDIKGNAYYCPEDDFVAYDAAFLLPQLNRAFGALTPSVVLAHEVGHAIQARIGVRASSVVTELQADCFAGAWVAFAETSDTDWVTIDERALDSSLRAIPLLRDQPGTPATNPQAHGLGFDRVNAFQEGYADGVPRCARFPEGDVIVTEVPFRTLDEALTQGNLGYAETLAFSIRYLDTFWVSSLPGLSAATPYEPPTLAPQPAPPLPDCPDDPATESLTATAYCAPTNTVAWATTSLARLHQSIGDMATATALSESWARSAQAQADLPTTGTEAELQRVCFTGAWIMAIASDGSLPRRLSPGDLDEALTTVLTPLSTDQVDAVESTAFERAAALRAGMLDGLAGCAG